MARVKPIQIDSMASHSQGVKAKKHLGQHFLNDHSIAERIAQSVQCLDPAAIILEIGPGTGALTRPLIDRFGTAVLALDVDSESVSFLRSAPWMDQNLVLEADFLRMQPTDLPDPKKKLVITGNFPYNISSQILFKLLDWREQSLELTGMFQKEVAERVCAQHGSKTYGILSVLIQTYFEAEYLFTVPPHVFTPPPKVQSGVLRLLRRKEALAPEIPYAHLKRVTKAAFNQRRKTLRNALKSGGLDINGVPSETLSLRAEQLSPSEFAQLAVAIPGTP
jgi:16S rRNA (adenine1518-N6/adenine1519-N6)-dimethyltransferase